MIKMTIRHFELVYLTKQDALHPPTIQQEVKSLSIPAHHLEYVIKSHLVDNHDFRIVFIKSGKNSPGYLQYYVYWDRDIDLDLLDRRAEAGNITPDDFSKSLLCQYHQFWCVNGHIWDVLTPELEFNVISGIKDSQERHEKRHSYKCPNCDGSFRQIIVKIFSSNKFHYPNKFSETITYLKSVKIIKESIM